MSSFRQGHQLLLLVGLTVAILGSSTASAQRILKGNPAPAYTYAHRTNIRAQGGCLNYGHSCLGAHGKRAVDMRPAASSRQPSVPRPLLEVLLNALNTASRTSSQRPAYTQLRQRYPSDLTGRALLMEDVNEADSRPMADGNEDASVYGYTVKDSEPAEEMFILPSSEDYSETRYRRDAGNGPASKVFSLTTEGHPAKEEKKENDNKNGDMRKSEEVAEPKRLVDFHIQADWVRR